MKTALIHSLTSTFQAQAQPIDAGAPIFRANPCHRAAYALDPRFVDANKAMNAHRPEQAGKPPSSTPRARAVSAKLNSEAIDASVITKYRHQHIRPLAVRPLNYPEREPTPWGFLFCAPANSARFPLEELCA